MKKPLCISVFVFGDYTRYIPYYIYTMLRSYPDYYVKVFSRDRLPNNVKTCLDLIKQKVSSNFEIKQQYMRNIKLPDPQVGKALKYIMPYDEYAEFDNVYIGDVDFIIIKEKPSLLEGHLKNCKRSGLPYSNQVRPNTKRLTGLHFFRVDNYYKKMNPVIEHYRNHLDELYKELKTYSTNEQFLYNLVAQGAGFGKGRNKIYRPHHGFHLGIIRGRNPKVKYKRYMEEDLGNPMFLLPSNRVFKRELIAYYDEPLFNKIISINPIKEVLLLKELLSK